MGIAASTASTAAKAAALPGLSALRCRWIRKTGTKTATKHSGIATGQVGGARSNTVHIASTAIRTMAASGWIGESLLDCGSVRFREFASGGNTSIGTSFASDIFGGACIFRSTDDLTCHRNTCSAMRSLSRPRHYARSLGDHPQQNRQLPSRRKAHLLYLRRFSLLWTMPRWVHH